MLPSNLSITESFPLCLQEVDMGLYVCAVSAWSANSQGDVVKITEHRSPPQTVRWVTKRKEASGICPHLLSAGVVLSG